MRRTSTKVGFWHSKYEPHLPMPQKAKWSRTARYKVINYLKNGKTTARYRGSSTCRICNCRNGSQEQSDGVYVWPSGLAHYVEKHSTGLPQEFVDHILDE